MTPAPWTCACCRHATTQPCCPRCGQAHGSANTDCTWTDVPDDAPPAAGRVWVTQQCPHGLARFVVAGDDTD